MGAACMEMALPSNEFPEGVLKVIWLSRVHYKNLFCLLRKIRFFTANGDYPQTDNLLICDQKNRKIRSAFVCPVPNIPKILLELLADLTP